MNAGSSPDGSGGLVADFTVVAFLVVVVAVDEVVGAEVVDVVVAVAANHSTSYSGSLSCPF